MFGIFSVFKLLVRIKRNILVSYTTLNELFERDIKPPLFLKSINLE